MKKFFILLLSLFFSLTTVGHAVQYPLEVAVTDTDMTVTLSGATGQTTPLLILAQTAPFQGNAVDYAQNNGIVRFLDEGVGKPSPFDRTRQPNSSGVAVWKFSTLPNTTYYIRIYNVTNIANPQLVTETKTVTTPKVTSFYGASLAITTNGQQASFAGKVDTSRYGTVAPMRITLEYALDKDFAQKQIAQSTKTKGGAIEGVSDDGTYYFELSGLTPKQLYFFRQIVQIGGTTITVPGDSFRAGETYVPSGSVEATVNDNVYNLLAPWPNFTKLMDPGMCAQQKAQGTLPANAVCDVNGFINFAFKTLIGLTAVMLVLRLVYEGYKYVVTDVPFLKANAKSEFGTALVGLLIALSAYTIFNTINPKLVSNTISIDQVAVGVDNETETAPNTTYDIGGDSRSCPEGFVDVTTFGTPNKINVCKSISQKLTEMIAAAKANNIILSGYGSRSTERQRQLRRDHGCPNDTMSSSLCRPPTARPGHSMHERGKAVDFTCNGTSINSRNNPCFVWLNTNAVRYGFKNLASEPWHWSTTGK